MSEEYRDLPLNGGADRAINDDLGKDTNGTRHAKEDSVVVGLRQTVVLEENTRMGINVGERVLGLAMLGKNLGGNLVDLADKLEHGVLGHVGYFITLESLCCLSIGTTLTLSKHALGSVTWIRLAEDGVTVTRHNAASLERVPKVLGDGLVTKVVANGLLHLSEPVEHLLVGKAVQGTSKTVKTSS